MSDDFHEHLKKRFPEIKWHEPVRVHVLGGASALVCRICIAGKGLHAQDVDAWPKDTEGFDQHMKKEHGVINEKKE